MSLPRDFYKDVEKPGYLKYILYSDTDSLFITIPITNAEVLSLENKWKLACETAEDINKMIVDYTCSSLLVRQNIDPKYNRTFFKTEFLMEAIIFLDVKKNYASKLICKEGKPVLPAKIQYTNISVKSDISNMTKKLLREMIEDVMLNKTIETKNKLDHLINVVNKYKKLFNADINNSIFTNIGTPSKWSKRDNVIESMKVYNYIIGKETFTPGSAGKSIYCIYRNPMLFNKSGIDLSKVKTICVPYEYNHNELKEKLQKFNIVVDTREQWERVYTTVCQRVVDLAKKLTI